jgi:hypothetical protein
MGGSFLTQGNEGFPCSQIFMNVGGQRAPLTGERLSAVQRNGVTSNGEAASSLGEDANLLMLVQIPLKYRAPRRAYKAASAAASDILEGGAGAVAAEPAPAAAAPANRRRAERADVEVAVLGHGPELGPYTELDGLTIERDPRFPVRVTVQFYQATSNGVLTAAVAKTLSAQIRRVYRSADYVGSLVTPRAHEPARVTAWDGISAPPGPWAAPWLVFAPAP